MRHIILSANKTHITNAAKIWEAGWHEAHRGIVPADLIEARTSASFRERLNANRQNTRIGITNGVASGLCMTREDEIHQLYVSPVVRGNGLGQMLLEDAECSLVRKGHELAWLACVVGNVRAARFYEKSGWRKIGVRALDIELKGSPGSLSIWRFEKRLA